ncbi:MAG: nicotinate (nicotinamide) nucleotide adenylyltransferase, partial [Burkholderiales bacterium]
MNTNAIGLFGGTFDPLHAGHMHIATTALAALPIAKLRWIPSGDPGHRNAPVAKGTHRLAMVRVAIAGEPRFELDAAEVLSGKPTFTVPTLRRLRAALGHTVPLVLVSGADSCLSLPTWHAWRELFDLAHIAVAARP